MIVNNFNICKLDKYHKLKKYLLRENCRFLRPGKGDHEIWITKDNRRISIPKHNIYKRNTIRQITKLVEGTWIYR